MASMTLPLWTRKSDDRSWLMGRSNWMNTSVPRSPIVTLSIRRGRVVSGWAVWACA
jgi:hypothetical protein